MPRGCRVPRVHVFPRGALRRLGTYSRGQRVHRRHSPRSGAVRGPGGLSRPVRARGSARSFERAQRGARLRQRRHHCVHRRRLLSAAGLSQCARRSVRGRSTRLCRWPHRASRRERRPGRCEGSGCAARHRTASVRAGGIHPRREHGGETRGPSRHRRIRSAARGGHALVRGR